MSGSKGKASGAWEPPEHRDILFKLSTVQRMLPLVRRIVDDILAGHKKQAAVTPELNQLDRGRRALSWPARQRRYRLQDEAAAADRAAHEAEEELHGLGVELLDSELGRVGFPTMVNNRPAFFSWHHGEADHLHSWHFAEETACRPIPPAWLQEITVSGAS